MAVLSTEKLVILFAVSVLRNIWQMMKSLLQRLMIGTILFSDLSFLDAQ
jgi:hypothetical protein